jgi:hypothetical protein
LVDDAVLSPSRQLQRFCLNIRGREAQGIVAPGNEQGDALAEVVEGMRSFCDIETGTPIADSVEPIEDLVGACAKRRTLLPDVVVRWSERPATAGVGVRSDKHGDLHWERGARFQSGRSGNHLPFGWMIASGPDIEAGIDCGCRETVDLTPTIFHWLGLPAAPRFVGTPIDRLLQPHA